MNKQYESSDSSSAIRINDLLKEKSRTFSDNFNKKVYINNLKKRFESSKVVDKRNIFYKILDYFKKK